MRCEIPTAETLAALPSVDVWGINAYRGMTLSTLFDEWAAVSGKPMFMGEYGADAWDSRVGAESQVAQAEATTALVDEIAANSVRLGGVCSGGLIFEVRSPGHGARGLRAAIAET